MLELNKIYNEDCLIGMKNIDDHSVDLIIADLPYATTNVHWDELIPLNEMWIQFKRIIKDRCAIILFADEPFTSKLILSNPKWYKVKYIWDKVRPTGFLNCKKQPLKRYEEIIVFYEKQCTYNPQMTKGKLYNTKAGNKTTGDGNMVYNKFNNIGL